MQQEQIAAAQEERQLETQQRHAAQSNRHVGGSVSPRKRSSPTYNRWQIEEENLENASGESVNTKSKNGESTNRLSDNIGKANKPTLVNGKGRRANFTGEMQSWDREYERSRRQFENGEGKYRPPGQ
jgi:hypothetical protein